MDVGVTCEHLNLLTDHLEKKLWHSNEELSCYDCNSPGPNLWICLQPECHHIGCSEGKNDHSTIHQKNYPLHCVHMNISTERIWCYVCEKEVHIKAALAYQSTPTSMLSSGVQSRYGPDRSYGLTVPDGDEDNGESEYDDEDSRTRGLVGLQNMGNTCYMNAALQALSHTPPLTAYFLDCAPALQVLVADKKTAISRSYQKLIRDMWNRKTRGYVVPNGILYGIRNVHPMFRGYHQHDTQEFLRCFMDQLHEELKEPICDNSTEDKLSSESEVDYDTRNMHVRRRAASSGANDAPYFARMRRKSPASFSESRDGYYRVSESDRGRHRRSASFAGTHQVHYALTHHQLHVGSHPGVSAGSSSSSLSCSSEERFETCSSNSDQPDTTNDHNACVSGGGGRAGGDGGGGGCARYRSVISDVFDGTLLSSVQCLVCDRVSTRVETFQDLSLPIPSRDHLAVLRSQQQPLNQHTQQDSWVWWIVGWLRSWLYGPVVSLQDCLAAFFSADELKGDNMYSCSRCNKLRNGVKMSGVLRLPEVLCVHLKRFRHELMYSSKLAARVSFPLHRLDMQPYTHKECTSKITNYELCAVICHSGTAGGGHYTCVARTVRGWHEFDDQCVTKLTPGDVQRAEAYVLFYRKVNPQMAILRQKAAEILNSTTVEPNDIKFYISKQWINKFNTWAEPGPIDNSDFVCRHGGVRGERAGALLQLAAVLPQPLWEFLYHHFGGGPACTHVAACTTCARLADRLATRRQRELGHFYALNKMFQEQEHPRAIYAISMHWFRQWQAFVRNKTQTPPPPIDNTGILTKQEIDGITSYILKPGSDHAQLSEELWRFFTDLYGGGPEVRLRGPTPIPTLPRKYSQSDHEDYCNKSTSETNIRDYGQGEALHKNQSLQNINKTRIRHESDDDNYRRNIETNGNQPGNIPDSDVEMDSGMVNGIDSPHDANDNQLLVTKKYNADVELLNLDSISLKAKKSGRVRRVKRRTVK